MKVEEKDLTPWFNGKTHKPARPGVYMQRAGSGGEIGFQKWDGNRWLMWNYTPAEAARSVRPASSNFQNDDWRGLRQKGKK